MAGTGRLCIYDSADNWIVGIAETRRADAYIGADSLKKLRTGLDQLVASRRQFRKVVFDTHGGEGRIWFSNDKIMPSTWKSTFSGKGYERLFPNYTKMYFSGCNVSENELGWQFLEEAGSTLLSIGGGICMAYTSLGFGAHGTSITPKHFWGDLKLVITTSGKKPRRVAGSDLIVMARTGDLDEDVSRAIQELMD